MNSSKQPGRVEGVLAGICPFSVEAITLMEGHSLENDGGFRFFVAADLDAFDRVSLTRHPIG